MLKRNFFHNKKFIPILVMLLGVILLSGCNETKTKQDDVKQEVITYTDSLNRTVTFTKKPERVAALLGSFADVWTLSGGTVCAAPEDAWDDYGLDLKEAVNIGGAHSPSLEGVLASNPDLVLASSSTASNVEIKDALEDAGISVIYFDVDCFDDYLKMLKVCTDLTDREDLYEQNGLLVKEKIDSLKAELEKAELGEEDKTILLIRVSSGLIKAKGSEGTILGEMLSDLGCVNIADSDTSLLENLSVESVIEKEPKHIFVVTMGDDTQKAVDNLDRMMKDNPAWGTLEAVKNNRVHVMDKMSFNLKPNEKWAESYEKIMDILLEKE